MIRIVEVSPRDGLQYETQILDTHTKVALINALSQSGVDEIEVSSFVSPKWVPQLADAEKVFHAIDRNPNVIYSALVPNMKGFERALVANPNKVAIFTAVSETFNQHNVNTSREDSIKRLKKVVPKALDAGMRVRGYLSTVFWCPYEGRTPTADTVDMAVQLIDIGCNRVALGDTMGRATPDHVREVLDALLMKLRPSQIAMHFHDTFGRAADNVRTAYTMGITRFDSSVGGLGGCPYAGAKAPGNVATQTVVRTLREAGATVHVDLEKLCRARLVIGDMIERRVKSPDE